MTKDELLRKYLDGELPPEEEKEALHAIADDEELRSMLRFENKLNALVEREFPVRVFDPGEVPAGFSDRVMYRISRQQAEETDLFAGLRDWYRRLWIPQQVQWRPAYSFVVALLLIVSLSYPVFLTTDDGGRPQQAVTLSEVESSVQQVSSGADEVMLRFVYIDDEATSVAVAGDFSDWKPIGLSRQQVNGEQVWTGLVTMTRGEHNYMFVKNGDQWVTDPLAPVQRDDGFGNKNAVIYL